MKLTDRLYARFLTTVAVRMVKPPAVSLTDRAVGPAEVLMVPTRHGPVRCYVTRPAPDAAPAFDGGRPPVHVNLHGGAFILGAPHQDDHLVAAIAGETGAVVVNVDYSAGTSVRYPKAHEECFDVVRWISGAGEQQGWDAGRLTLSGTSAGGNLALGVLELARREGGPRVAAAVLVVPTVDQTVAPGAHVAPPGSSAEPFVSARLVRIVHGHYFADAARRAEPLASPALGVREQLEGLPPLLVFGAERDSLRPAIERWVEKAREAGADVDYRCMPGVDHPYTNQPGKDGVPALRETATATTQFISSHHA